MSDFGISLSVGKFLLGIFESSDIGMVEPGDCISRGKTVVFLELGNLYFWSLGIVFLKAGNCISSDRKLYFSASHFVFSLIEVFDTWRVGPPRHSQTGLPTELIYR